MEGQYNLDDSLRCESDETSISSLVFENIPDSACSPNPRKSALEMIKEHNATSKPKAKKRTTRSLQHVLTDEE